MSVLRKHCVIVLQVQFKHVFKEWICYCLNSTITSAQCLMHKKIDNRRPVTGQLKGKKKNPLIKRVVVDAQWLASAFKPTEGKKIHSFVLVYGRRKILHLLYNILPRLTFNYQANSETNHCPCSVNGLNLTSSLKMQDKPSVSKAKLYPTFNSPIFIQE